MNARSVGKDLGNFAALAKCSHSCVRIAGYCQATSARIRSFTANRAAAIETVKHSTAFASAQIVLVAFATSKGADSGKKQPAQRVSRLSAELTTNT